MAIREGKWRCPACDLKNLGRDVHCQGCGKARENVEFFLDDDAPEVNDAALLAVAEGGADWICKMCDQSNRSSVTSCVSCGGPRSEGVARQESYRPLPQAPLAPAYSASPLPGTNFLSSCGVFAVVILLGCVALGFFSFMARSARVASQRSVPVVESVPEEPEHEPSFVDETRHDVALVTTSVHWRSHVDIAHLAPQRLSDWTVPDGARVISKSEEIRSHRQVQTGTRDVPRTVTERVYVRTDHVKVGTKNMGNGFFKDVYEDRKVYQNRSHTVYDKQPVYRDEPVYATKYVFEIDKWSFERSIVLEGSDLDPLWPEVDLHGDPTRREQDRGMTFTVTLEDATHAEFTFNPDRQSDFELFVKGSRWTGDVVDRTKRAAHLRPRLPEAVAAEVTSSSW